MYRELPMAKKKRSSIARTTVSLPADLLKRMRACGAEVNWSGIAASAFAAEVARLNIKKENTKMDDVIARLRSALRAERSAIFDEGYEAGSDWAMKEAGPNELKRLAEQRNAKDPAIGWLTKDVATKNLYACDAFFKWIRPTEYRQYGEYGANDFWEELFPDDVEKTEDDEFVHGFALGAFDVWKQVDKAVLEP
jgi:post-segregation antitoxin (ccd killing protein)